MRAKIFKSISFFLLVSSLIFVTSCEDDAVSSIKSSDIIGVWTVESSATDITIAGMSLVEYVMDALDLTEAEALVFIDENMGGMDDMSEMAGTIEMKEDGTYVANFEGEDPNDVGTWRLSSDGKTLYIDEGDVSDEMIFDVLTLTASRLVIESTMTEELEGTTDTMEMTLRINFTK